MIDKDRAPMLASCGEASRPRDATDALGDCDPVLSEIVDRLASTLAWLVKAGNDLRGAEIDMAATPPLSEDALFHCQQAAEKALKAFLTWHDTPFRKTHSIEELGEQAIRLDPTLEPLVNRAAPLTHYACLRGRT